MMKFRLSLSKVSMAARSENAQFLEILGLKTVVFKKKYVIVNCKWKALEINYKNK